MCYPLWTLLLSFLSGALSMLILWLILARVAMGGIVVPGGRGSDSGGNGRG